jgi:CHAT domain-containing protein
MVVYQALGDRLLAWVVRADRTELLRLAVAAEVLGDRVEALRDAMTTAGGAGESARDAAAEVYELILAEPLAVAGEARHLVVVPDKALHLVPFGALYDRAAGEYLVERTTVSLAPSARVYLRALERSRAAGGVPPSSLLAIGDPSIDRELFPGLQPLAAARREVETLAGIYPRADTLSGGGADAATVVALAGGYEVLHFATHALANPETAHGAALLLAPPPAGSAAADVPAGEPADQRQALGGALYASEVAGLDLSGAHLVVLAACDTGGGPLRAGEGVISLARAFLAAGVPAVVQSLWAVDDRTASELLLAFHRELLTGADPATALRTAQRGFLHHPDPARRHPAAWAAWAVVGGVG